MKLSHIAPPPHLNIFAGLVFCALILTTGQGFGETYNDGQVHDVSTAMTSAVTVSNATTLNWTYNAAYPLRDKALTVTGGSTFYYNQAQEVLGNTSASFSGAGTKATLDYYTANSGGITINDGAVLNITNKANNGYGALLGNGGGGINTTSGSATLNLYGATTSTWGYASLRDSYYKINISKDAELTVNGGLYNTYTTNQQGVQGSHDLIKEGAGTLIVQNGKIGVTHSGGATTFSAAKFVINGGKVQLANKASIYSGATIQLAAGTTMDIESSAAASTNVTFTGFVDATTKAVSGGAVNVKGKLLSTGVTVSNGVTLTLNTEQTLAGIALTLNKATLVVGTANDVLYHQFNTSNVTDSTITANTYTTLDGKYQLYGTNSITSTANGHANYGSFLFNGGTIKDEVINLQGGTTTITTPETSNGIRMRSAYSGFEVAANANLVVNSDITYDPREAEGDKSVATEIYKTGAGTMTLSRGTIGAFQAGINAGDFSAGNVHVKQGTLEISGTGMIYSGSTVNVDAGATLNFTSTNTSSHVSNANYNVSGTMRIGCVASNGSSNIAGNIVATGSNALIDLAVNDPFGMAHIGGNPGLNMTFTLKDGATLTNSITRTAASNDTTSHITMLGKIVLEGGKITSKSIGRQAGSYGNYLMANTITVQGDKTSTIDAYMFQIRNGSLTIKPGATLEICSRVSSNGPAWNIDGGGTFRPITQTRTIQTDGTNSQSYTQEFKFLTNHAMNFKNVTLDLTSLDTPITTIGKEWKLFSTAATDSLGGISSTGKITTTDDTKIQVELTVKDGKLVGQTLQAPSFEIEDSTLELVLDKNVAWDQNANLLNDYKFFSDETWGSFANIAVSGNLGELHLELNADGTGFTAYLPEPSTWVLLLLGVGGICCLKRRTSNK